MLLAEVAPAQAIKFDEPFEFGVEAVLHPYQVADIGSDLVEQVDHLGRFEQHGAVAAGWSDLPQPLGEVRRGIGHPPNGSA